MGCSGSTASTVKDNEEAKSEIARASQEEELPSVVADRGGFQAGQVIRAQGLQNRADLNGLEGTVTAWDEQEQRWKVRLSDGKSKLMKPENMQLIQDDRKASDAISTEPTSITQTAGVSEGQTGSPSEGLRASFDAVLPRPSSEGAQSTESDGTSLPSHGTGVALDMGPPVDGERPRKAALEFDSPPKSVRQVSFLPEENAASPSTVTSKSKPTQESSLQLINRKKKTGELRELSKHAKESLQAAFVDGRLTTVLRSEGHLAPDLGHSKAASLVPDLGHVKADGFRRWARARLLESRSLGHLDTLSAVLSKLTVPVPYQQGSVRSSSQTSNESKAVQGAPQNTPILCKDLASSGGEFATVPKTIEGLGILRRRGRRLLLDAYADMRLEKAAKTQCKLVPDTQVAKAEEFRRRARQTLLESQSDGRLEMLILALSWSYSDIDPCREMLQKGRLEQTTTKLKSMHSAQRVDPLLAFRSLTSREAGTSAERRPVAVSIADAFSTAMEKSKSRRPIAVSWYRNDGIARGLLRAL